MLTDSRGTRLLFLRIIFFCVPSNRIKCGIAGEQEKRPLCIRYEGRLEISKLQNTCSTVKSVRRFRLVETVFPEWNFPVFHRPARAAPNILAFS